MDETLLPLDLASIAGPRVRFPSRKPQRLFARGIVLEERELKGGIVLNFTDCAICARARRSLLFLVVGRWVWRRGPDREVVRDGMGDRILPSWSPFNRRVFVRQPQL